MIIIVVVFTVILHNGLSYDSINVAIHFVSNIQEYAFNKTSDYGGNKDDLSTHLKISVSSSN